MKFKVGNLPQSYEFNPDEDQWKAIREPNNIWVYQLYALPVGLIFASAIYLFSIKVLGVTSPLKGSLLLSILFIIPVHELLHAVVFPKFTSNSTIIGFYPKGLAFYAYYEGEIRRNRFILVLLMPIIGLSLFPILSMYIINAHSRFWVQVSIFNILFACVDLVGLYFVLLQTPMKAILRNKGVRTYWRGIG